MKEILLEINQLSIHFGGIIALTAVSFNVNKETITSIIGPNGAGKTTLFNCLTGFYKATSGKLIYHEPHRKTSITSLLGEPFKLSHLIQLNKGLKVLYYKMFGEEPTLYRNMV